tara:strand:- start:2080 stop:2298 length:219 start_codon:yes stop_codon:yes gene_type:complete
MKAEMKGNVVLYRLFWGLLGGNTKNNSSIKTILIDPSFFIWGQRWGQRHATNIAWNVGFNTYFHFCFKNKNK